MSILLHILAAGLLTRTAAVGIATLLSCRWLAGLSEQLLAVACGLLTAIALTHLIPEAMEMPGVEPHDLGLVMLGTMLVFWCLSVVCYIAVMGMILTTKTKPLQPRSWQALLYIMWSMVC